MHTETIDLIIDGIGFDGCVVNFEYEQSDAGSLVQPAYVEELNIYRVQMDIAEPSGIQHCLWCDINEAHHHLVYDQVLAWIHNQQEESILDKAETYTERRMREMENETWRP